MIIHRAVVDFSETAPQTDYLSEACKWKDVSDLRPMILDHQEMISKAMEVLRSKLYNEPIGYNLLNEKFTIPELQALYETVLDKKLDRRNFLGKIISYYILLKLDEKRTGGAQKAAYFYSFDKNKYHRALLDRLNSCWWRFYWRLMSPFDEF